MTPTICTTTSSALNCVSNLCHNVLNRVWEKMVSNTTLNNVGNVVLNRGINFCNNLFHWGWDKAVIDIAALENRDQIPTGGLPIDMVKHIFGQCISNGDIKGFMALGLTNVHSFLTMRKLVNEIALTKLCPNLRILDAKTFTFHSDLRGIDRYKAFQSYYKLEPFVEGREGLTIIFNQGGLTLKNMKENNCGIAVNVNHTKISEELDDIPEKDTGPEMISNAPITWTRNKWDSVQELRVCSRVGFNGKPTLIQHLALMIATQKELKICLYGAGENPLTYGCTSTYVENCPLDVSSDPGQILVYLSEGTREDRGAAGRLKL